MDAFRDMCMRAALAVDTLVSRAMLRALGVPAPEPAPREGAVVRVGDARYEGMLWCFENHGSPMDGIR